MTLHLRVHSGEFRVESASGLFVQVTIMSICNNTLMSRVKRDIVLFSTILDSWVKDQQLQTPLNNFLYGPCLYLTWLSHILWMHRVWTDMIWMAGLLKIIQTTSV